MTIQELTPDLAKEIATELMNKILAEGREFTCHERKVIQGLMGLVSASNASRWAEYWRAKQQSVYFHDGANWANASYAQFEEAKALIAHYLVVSSFRENSHLLMGVDD